ncbi:DUF5959 family protein [Streptomyces sp. NPDC058155]|uniref:DUF5959 family protein n=1 Tax=Streptomyces sp. NPDC058155 TaxID=3346359 RepID=UPI0036E79E4E
MTGDRVKRRQAGTDGGTPRAAVHQRGLGFGNCECLGRGKDDSGADGPDPPDGESNSVALRITGRETRRGARTTVVLTGEFVVDTAFVSGTLNTWLFPADLTEWRECLDTLDAGQGITWRDAARAPALSIERDDAAPVSVCCNGDRGAKANILSR